MKPDLRKWRLKKCNLSGDTDSKSNAYFLSCCLISPEKSILTCAACRIYVASLLADRRNGAPAEDIADSAFGMCMLITSFSEQQCRGLMDINLDTMVYIVDSRPSLTAHQMCGLALQGQCGALDPSFSFTLSVSPGQPINQPKSFPTPRAPNDLKIIHISDMHYDENFVEGNLAACINSICCRRNDGVASNPADGAWFWGDYRVRRANKILNVDDEIIST